jgi:hypothetical protein
MYVYEAQCLSHKQFVHIHYVLMVASAIERRLDPDVHLRVAVGRGDGVIVQGPVSGCDSLLVVHVLAVDDVALDGAGDVVNGRLRC